MDSDANKARVYTRKSYERSFLNAKSNYDAWHILQQVLDWALVASELKDDLLRKNRNQAAEIVKLQGEIKAWRMHQ